MLCFVLDEIFENNGIEFTQINPDGSEWFSNDQLAFRNLTRLIAKSSEVYSKAISTHCLQINIFRGLSKKTSPPIHL